MKLEIRSAPFMQLGKERKLESIVCLARSRTLVLFSCFRMLRNICKASSDKLLSSKSLQVNFSSNQQDKGVTGFKPKRSSNLCMQFMNQEKKIRIALT